MSGEIVSNYINTYIWNTVAYAWINECMNDKSMNELMHAFVSIEKHMNVFIEWIHSIMNWCITGWSEIIISIKKSKNWKTK